MNSKYLARLRDRLSRTAPRQRLRRLFPVPPSSRLNYDLLRLSPDACIQIGDHSLVDGSLVTERPNARISIGDRTFMNGTVIAAKFIQIGDDVLIAWGVTIIDHDSHSLAFSSRARDVTDWARGEKDWSYVRQVPVAIGNKVWIGFNSIILKGVQIGEGAVVGAGSVVTHNVPPWTVVAGNPARIIREMAPDER